MKIDFRHEVLRHARNENLDLDELGGEISLTDFSLDDFVAQLKAYLEENREILENTPLGVYSIVDCAQQQQSLLPTAADAGVIFCLRQKNPPQDKRIRSPLKDYYLVYVRDDYDVRYNYIHAKQILELFGGLAYKQQQSDALRKLHNAFDNDTDHGKKMEKYDKLLEYVFPAISKQYEQQEEDSLNIRGGTLTKQIEQPRRASDFELVTWLVIKNGKKA